MRISILLPGTISWVVRLTATVALGLLLVLGFVPSGYAQVGAAQSPNGPLAFENNFFVTGDYVVAGAYNINSSMVTMNGNSYTVGTINVPDAKTVGKAGNPGITGATSVPAGAEILAALLYWQTVEKVGTMPGQAGSGQNGFFRPVYKNGPATGYPISGMDLMAQSSVAFSNGGCSGGSTGKVVRTYRAPVTGYLPEDPATGAVLANSTYEVTLPSSGNNTPLTLGASLVIIYRILSPNVPLNSIVIYDGAYGQTSGALNMQQTMQGFYDAAHNPVSRLTHIVASGQSNKYQNVSLNGTVLPSLYGHNAPAFPGYYGTWDNPTWTFDPNKTYVNVVNPVLEDSDHVTTMVAPTPSNQGCVSWGAVIVSTTVKSPDADGLLKSWKTNQGYCDASVNEGQCGGSGDPAWVDLTGAALGEKDLFVQLDYMCSKVLGPLSCDTSGANYSFNPGPATGAVLAPVVTAFQRQGINLHVVPGNAIQEKKCIDNDPNTTTPALCPYPNQPGVVGWKGGLVFIQNQFINTTTGQLDPPDTSGDVPVLQPAKKDSYHYALFAHAIGLPTWSLGAANLTSVVQSGTIVTFTTSTPHGLGHNANDTLCANGRVTVAYAITNQNLNGTACVTITGQNTFTIQVANSTKANYTIFTDPDLEVGSSQAGSVSGFSDVAGQDSLITLGNWGLDATVPVKTGTFMHELGHSLGLTHGGFYYNTAGSYVPTIGQNCKSNYLSVMNYMFQIDLMDPGNGQNVPDYSGQTLANISESSAGSNPFTNPVPLYSTSWHGTSVQVGVPANTTPLTLYCDGTPFPGANPRVYRVTRPASLFNWAAGQDINFDGSNDPTFVGYNDWTSTATTTGVDLRQIGATGSLSAAGMVGGGKQFGAGGGKQFGAGGGQQFGAGGGKQFGAGGGKQFGAGGGKQFGAGGGLGDLTQSIANSFTRPPRGLAATEEVSKRFIDLGWSIPTFGQIGAYRIYRALNGSNVFAVIATLPGTQLTYTDTVTCNPIGYQYYVTAVLAGTFPTFPPLANQGQESVPSNIAAISGQTGVKLTGCYTNTPPTVVLNNLSVPANQFIQGVGTVPITWSLQDDDTGTVVSNSAANTLRAIGPIPFDGTCSTLAKPPTYLNFQGSYPYTVTTLSSSGSGITGANPFTFNWNTTNFNAGCYFFELDLDSGQSETTPSALTLLIFVSDSSPHVVTTILPSGVVGSTYNNMVFEAGGISPFTWQVTAGTLPPGISLDPASGMLSGTTCQKGPYSFTAKVTDSLGNFGTQALMLTVLPAQVAQVNQPTAPESAVPGAAGIPLTINGTGFNSCSTVQWNGSALTTVLASATRLTTTIPSNNVTTAATASISVANPGSPTSNLNFFQVTNSTAGIVFLNPAGPAAAVGTSPNGVISVDFSGDKILDLAVANYGSNNVSIVLGNGDGTFLSAVPYNVGIGPSALTAGDFAGNGKLDLAVANFGDNTVSILLGNGDGTFATAVSYPVGNGPSAVVTGDFNGDGKLDLAIANQNDHTVSILLGNGDGTFQSHVDYPAGGSDVAGLSIGDFNGDGKLDLAATNPSTDQVSVLIGNGNGTFQAPVPYSTGPSGSHPIAVAAADFDGDGVLDLAITNLNSNTVAILLGNGNGTFKPEVSYPAINGSLSGPSAIITGDFDGDGNVDLVITDQGDNSVSILVGNGHGTFQGPQEINVGTFAAGVAAGDFNGDGRLDVAVVNTTDGTVSIMLQAPRVQLLPSPVASFGNVTVSGAPSAAQTVTLTNTGSADLTISGIAFTGTNSSDFSQTNNCPTNPNKLAAGSNCTINVTFAPAQAGARSASLSITDNATGNPQSVSVSGTGILAPATSLTATATASSGSVSLNWVASTSATVTGYNVYRGTASGGPYTQIATAVAATSYTDTVASGTYFYVVTAMDASNNESAKSDEATATD